MEDEDVKIYRPKHRKDVSPMFATNVITSNFTTRNGNVMNTNRENAGFAREWVDDNEK